MKKRIITGALIFIVSALFISTKLLFKVPYFFDLFVLGISYIAVYEMIKMYNQKQTVCSNAYSILSLVYVYVLCMINLFSKTTKMSIYLQALSFIIFFLVAFLCDLIFLSKAHKNEIKIEPKDYLCSTKRTLILMLYPTTLLGTLYGLNGLSGIGFLAIVTVFLITYFTDVFAFFVGSAIKKSKFAPQISPNKTISGAIGGVIGGVIACALVFVICYVLNLYNPFNGVKLWKVIVLFVSLGILGPFAVECGDLLESAIKRDANIKDLGNILPGHGGMMDRVDGLMFCSTLAYILVIVLFY